MPPPNNTSPRPDNKQQRGGNRGGGDRRGGGGRNNRKEPSEYEDVTLAIDRVTRVVKGGRRMRFRATVVLGNKKGKVGLGTGKATEVQAAVQKANRAAKRNMIIVPMHGDTIPHEVNIKFKSAKLRLMPASKGTGIIAGGPLRVILDLAGVKDILAKRFGTKNKLVNAQAGMMALELLRGNRNIAASSAPAVAGGKPGAAPAGGGLKDRSNKDLGLQDTPEENLNVKTVTKKEVDAKEAARKQIGKVD